MAGAQTQQPQAKPTEGGNLLDEIMDKTQDLRVKLGNTIGLPASQVLRYMRSFIALAKNCPDGFVIPWEDVVQFATVCKELEMNPARYECRAFYDYHKGLTVFVMIDGWLTLANRQPNLDGIDYEYDRDPENGNLVGVTSVIYRKDRTRPVKTKCLMREWRVGSSPQWQSKPEWMLQMKSLKHGLRIAFGFAGIMDDDEARQMGWGGDSQPDKKPVASAPTVNLKSLKPAAPPPDDEYTGTRAPRVVDIAAEADAMRREREAADDAAIPANGEDAERAHNPTSANAETPSNETPSAASPPARQIAPNTKIFVRRMPGSDKPVMSTVKQMSDTDLSDAHEANEAALADQLADDEKAHRLGVKAALEDEMGKRVK